jgi:hypothetical protein
LGFLLSGTKPYTLWLASEVVGWRRHRKMGRGEARVGYAHRAYTSKVQVKITFVLLL